MTVALRLTQAGLVAFVVFAIAYFLLWLLVLGGEYPK